MIEKCTCNRREKIDFSINKQQRMNECSFIQRHIQQQQQQQHQYQQNNPTPENPISLSCPQLSTLYANTTTTQHHDNKNLVNYNCNCYYHQPTHQQQLHHHHQYLHNYQHHQRQHHHQNQQQHIRRECMCVSGNDRLGRHFNTNFDSSKNFSIQSPHHWPSSTV